MSRVPLRYRLTAAFALAAALVLLVLGLFLHARLRAELDATLRSGLRQRAGDLVVVARDRRTDLGAGSLVDPGDDLVQILDRRGAIVDAAAGLGQTVLLTPDEVRRAASQAVEVDGRHVGREEEAALLLAVPAGERIVVVGASLEDRDDALAKLDGLLLVGLPVGLALAALAGYVVAGRALRPMERMRARAEAIGTDDLGRRLPEPRADDELRRLARTLNGMLDRVQAGFERERTFVADAGHELRTPLTALRAELELAGRPGRSADELRAAVASAAEETERLVRLTEELLVLARSDAGRLVRHPESVPVRELLERAVRHGATPAAGPGPDGLMVLGDRLRLEQALDNLVTNAVAHGAPPVEVSVVPAPVAGHVRLRVVDHGPGPGEELAGRAFERFTRGDTAREGDGHGLGLAIVAAIAEAHGGSSGIDATEDGRTVAWIQLPLARPT